MKKQTQVNMRCKYGRRVTVQCFVNDVTAFIVADHYVDKAAVSVGIVAEPMRWG